MCLDLVSFVKSLELDSAIAELRPGEAEEAAAPWTIEAGTRLEQREESRWRRQSS